MSQPSSPRIVTIGLAGLGNVGAGVFKNLERNRDLITQRTGADIRVRKVAVRDLDRPRDVAVPSDLLTTDWRDLIADPARTRQLARAGLEAVQGLGGAVERTIAAIEPYLMALDLAERQ